MIEELPAPRLAYRFTHELVRRALYDRLSRLRRAELHLRVGEALEARRGASRPGARRPRPSLRRGRAVRRGRARRSSTTCSRRGAASAALAFDEPASRLRTAIELGIDDEAERGRRLLELGAASHRAGKAVDALDAFAAAAEIARELGDASCSRGRRSATRRPAGARAWPSRDSVALLEEALQRSARSDSELRIGLLAGLARALDFQGERERGRDRPRRRRRAGAAPRRPCRARHGADALLLGARDDPARGDPRDADRGAGPRRGARGHRDPHRGDGLAGADLRRPRRPRVCPRARSPPCARWPSAPRSRSCTMSPSTTARRSPSATGTSRRPRRLARALARVGPAADRPRRLRRLRHPDVRRPPRAGAAGGVRAGDPDPRRRGPSATGRGGPGSSPLLAELGNGGRGAGGSSRTACRRGLDGFRDVALAGLAHLPDRRLRGARRRGHRGPRLSRARAARRRRT